tara:strand:+ start:108 stop:425 length:318 start_codon:yes stop_codon:yes gene_type:complete
MNKLKLLSFACQDDAINYSINFLQEGLDKFIEKHPDKDVKTRKGVIGVLRAYRETTLELYQTEKVMTKKYLEMAKKVDLLTKVNNENAILINENAILIRNLKTGL